MSDKTYHFVPRPIFDTEALMVDDEVAFALATRRGAFNVALDFTAPV